MRIQIRQFKWNCNFQKTNTNNLLLYQIIKECVNDEKKFAQFEYLNISWWEAYFSLPISSDPSLSYYFGGVTRRRCYLIRWKIMVIDKFIFHKAGNITARNPPAVAIKSKSNANAMDPFFFYFTFRSLYSTAWSHDHDIKRNLHLNSIKKWMVRVIVFKLKIDPTLDIPVQCTSFELSKV